MAASLGEIWPALHSVDGRLAVRVTDTDGLDSASQELLGRFLAALNGKTIQWRIDTDGRLAIDTVSLGAAKTPPDLARAIKYYQDRRIEQEGSSVLVINYPPYYVDVLISTSQWYDQHDTVKTAWLRGPGDVGFFDSRSYTWGFSIAGAEYSKILGWLGVNLSFGYTSGGNYSFPVPAGKDGRARQIDKHYHTTATYDEYYYECIDVPGVYVQFYMGRNTDSSCKFYERIFYCEYRNSI